MRIRPLQTLVCAVLGMGGCAHDVPTRQSICTQPPRSLAELASPTYEWSNLQEVCTTRVEAGTYGNFSIGDTKTEILQTITASGISHVNLVLSSGLLGEFADVDRDRRKLLDSQSDWSVDAFPTLCPFEPFYSRVTLHFEGRVLHHIGHFCLGYELP